ncbi:dUTP diphosphatase [Corynebacterium heidelbergense]|nr:dUTP diphosphatase [Corynebacterium heidelbergense]WCZ36033.1 Deoxyuridine 5'-triphosphate nucleotidohydrolase [Corynebacterium heidelbergense]
MRMKIVIDDGGFVPSRSHDGDAGLDLRASEYAVVPIRGRRLVRTGVHVEIPHGYVGLVCPRSGLAAKYGVSVLNAPGVVDHGYTGEVLVNLHNSGSEQFRIEPGDRIAQLVVQPVALPDLETVDALDDTERGDGGHGSTGV